jgi:hypothetical protein
MRKLLLVIALVCALAPLYGAVASAPAAAAGLSPPVADCSAHGRLTHHYPASELRTAINTMPADVAQYTNCPNVIRNALVSQIGPVGAGTGGGGGSFLPGWLIAVLVVLVLGGAGLAAVALRNRRRSE